MRRAVLLGLGLGLAILAAGATFYYVQKPSVLRVAVPRDSEDRAILAAAAQDFAQAHQPLRLELVVVESLGETPRALDDGRADLAIVRSDVAMPGTGQTILIMRKSVALLLATPDSGVREIDDLRGRKIGLLHAAESSSTGHQALLETMLAQRDIPVAEVRKVSLPPASLRAAIEKGDIDVVLAVGVQGGKGLAEVVTAVAAAGHAPPVFIPIVEAKAIAQRAPIFEPAEVLRGAFGGAQPRPADDFETLGVSTRLVASRDLADDTVGDLLRLLLEARTRIGTSLAGVNRMAAPPTDKDAALPVHPGAIAYLEDGTEGFFDKYSDFIYVGAMVLSLAGTGLVALASRLGSHKATEADRILRRLVDILHSVRGVDDPASLELFQREADALLALALTPSVIRASHANHLAALNVAMSEVRQAIAERRRLVASRARSNPFTPRLVRD